MSFEQFYPPPPDDPEVALSYHQSRVNSFTILTQDGVTSVQSGLETHQDQPDILDTLHELQLLGITDIDREFDA